MVGTRRPLVTVERRFVDAAVDVFVDDWRTRWSPVRTVSSKEWEVIDREWTAELCDVLDSLADNLLELVGGLRQGVAHGVASVLMTFGVPPLLAQILGRLVANWLLEGLGPVGAVALRLKELGVLLCAGSDRLDNCACLVDVVTMLGVKGFKKELHQALGLDQDGDGPTTATQNRAADWRSDSDRDAASRAAVTGAGSGNDSVPARMRATFAGERPGGEAAAGASSPDRADGTSGGASAHPAGRSGAAAGAANNAAPAGGAPGDDWTGGSATGPRRGSSGSDSGSEGDGGAAAPGPTGRGGPWSGGAAGDGGVGGGPTDVGGRGTDPAGGASGAGSSGTGPHDPGSGPPGGEASGGAAAGPGPADPGGGPWSGGWPSGGDGPTGPRSNGARPAGAAADGPDRPIADASEAVRGATATMPTTIFG